MHNLPLTTLLLAALLGLSQCTKKDPDPVDQLPPATQTGANTVGCLLNGQLWAPVGNGTSKNFFIDYDTGYTGGLFNLSVEKDLGNNTLPSPQTLSIYVNPLPQTGVYLLTDLNRTRVLFNDPTRRCVYESREVGTYCRGTLTITRLDMQARIIAGTFEFTLAKPGCDTLKFTQGRFDKKL
ncbi:hypothetical protein [Hymenobacter rubidus]|uniref:hypothetical protein n=1 Tax=Hymenobacter rubidus TaxID=1441626 RepID=UPI00191E11DA|nr:hypothetical protein [Hymenobacter rubidus]